jgi:hypothetical protein
MKQPTSRRELSASLPGAEIAYCVCYFPAAWLTLVANRRELMGDPWTQVHRTRLDREAAVRNGPSKPRDPSQPHQSDMPDFRWTKRLSFTTALQVVRCTYMIILGKNERSHDK